VQTQCVIAAGLPKGLVQRMQVLQNCLTASTACKPFAQAQSGLEVVTSIAQMALQAGDGLEKADQSERQIQVEDRVQWLMDELDARLHALQLESQDAVST
jgi:hypothetical protein